MQIFSTLVLTVGLVLGFTANASTTARVPHIFTGDSPAPAYQNFSKYRYKKDARDSRGYAEYYYDQAKLDRIHRTTGVSSVHTMVRNIAKDGLCGTYSTCFRVYVFVNGDQDTGSHVATFVVSPGTGRRTPRYNNAKLRNYTRYLYKFERPTQFGSFDMYRIYGSKSYPDPVPNMPNAMFFDTSIALHGSFGKVNGGKQSHGCIRMNPDESYWLHTLVRAAQGRMTVDVFHTR